MAEDTENQPAPRIVYDDALLIVGLKKRYDHKTSVRMPSQWAAFRPYIATITNRVTDAAYGVLYNSDAQGSVDYLTGVAVNRSPDKMDTLECLRLAPQTYAVFTHVGHVGDIKRTWKAIFDTGLAQTGRLLAAAPKLERYGPQFDMDTGVGDIEIWIPVHP